LVLVLALAVAMTGCRQRQLNRRQLPTEESSPPRFVLGKVKLRLISDARPSWASKLAAGRGTGRVDESAILPAHSVSTPGIVADRSTDEMKRQHMIPAAKQPEETPTMTHDS
jgi:hypothetical protein